VLGSVPMEVVDNGTSVEQRSAIVAAMRAEAEQR